MPGLQGPLPFFGAGQFAFPGGRQAGFNPQHPAFKGRPGQIVSVVPRGATLTNILTGVNASAGVGTLVNTGWGPCINTAAGAAGQAITTGFGAITPTTFTMGIIFSNASGSTWLVDQAGASGNGVFITSLVLAPQADGGNVTISLATVVANIPHFFAWSVVSGTGLAAGVLVNLSTGQTTFGTGTLGTMGAQTAAWTFGGQGAGTAGAANRIFAGMIATNGIVLTVPELLLWAQDPWSFWYPQPMSKSLMFTGLRAAAPLTLQGATRRVFM